MQNDGKRKPKENTEIPRHRHIQLFIPFYYLESWTRVRTTFRLCLSHSIVHHIGIDFAYFTHCAIRISFSFWREHIETNEFQPTPCEF